jgi:hypothetical protein
LKNTRKDYTKIYFFKGGVTKPYDISIKFIK